MKHIVSGQFSPAWQAESCHCGKKKKRKAWIYGTGK